LQDAPTCEMRLLFHHWEGLHDPLESILKHLPLAELLLHVLLITELPELELIGLDVSHQGVIVSQQLTGGLPCVKLESLQGCRGVLNWDRIHSRWDWGMLKLHLEGRQLVWCFLWWHKYHVAVF
jgi:hypothetical protein